MDRSRTAGSKGVPRERREQLILNAATDAFGAYGYAGAALSTVASSAGVSKQLVLSYFGTKDQLYVACLKRAGRNLIDRIEQVLAAGGPPLRTAENTLTAIFEGLEERPHDWNVIHDRTPPYGSSSHEAGNRIRATIAEQAARGVARLADLQLLTDPADLSVLTEVWTNIVTAFVAWWLRHPEQTPAQMSLRAHRIITALTVRQ